MIASVGYGDDAPAHCYSRLGAKAASSLAPVTAKQQNAPEAEANAERLANARK